MSSKVEICNKALLLIGQPNIMSLSDDTKAAKACNQEFQSALEDTLREYPWPFATKRKILARTNDVPDFGFAYYYSLPSECIRIVSSNLKEAEEPYKIEGNKLATSAEEVKIIYIAKDVEISLIPPDVVKCIAYKLAATIAVTILQNPDMQGQLSQQYEYYVQKARNAAANDDYPQVVQEGDWIPSRRNPRSGAFSQVWNPWGSNGKGVSRG